MDTGNSANNNNSSLTTRRAVVSNDRRKIITNFPDGGEMIEEFDVITDELLVRKRRAGKDALGREQPWVFEVGAEQKVFRPEVDTLRESSTNPTVTRKDSADFFEWRIRNLPYDKSVFDVQVHADRQSIVVRTSNKKYYKVIDIPDLKRVGVDLRPDYLSWDHKHNTLLIMYKKEKQIKEFEVQAKKERATMKPERPGDEVPQCQQQ